MMRLFIIVAVCLSFITGCGKKSEEKKKIIIDFWHIMNYSGPKEILSDAVHRFELAHPEAKVRIQTFANDAYKTKLAVELVSGNLPDIFFTWGGGSLFDKAEHGKVFDLSQVVKDGNWESDFLPQALKFCQKDGNTYALPLDLSAVVFWYDQALFIKHGLTPPKTFADLLLFCKKCRSKGITPLALGNSKKWTGAFYYDYLALRQGGIGRFNDALDTENSLVDFAHSDFVLAGKKLEKLISSEAFSKGVNATVDDRARTRFLAGRAAMYLMGTWLVSKVQNEKKEMLKSLTCCRFPMIIGGDGKESSLLGGMNCGFAISAKCKHPKLTIELLRFLTDETVAQKWCTIGRIPALKISADQQKLLPKQTAKVLQMINDAEALQPYYDQLLPPRAATVHKESVQSIFAGECSAAESAEALQKALQK